MESYFDDMGAFTRQAAAPAPPVQSAGEAEAASAEDDEDSKAFQ